MMTGHDYSTHLRAAVNRSGSRQAWQKGMAAGMELSRHFSPQRQEKEVMPHASRMPGRFSITMPKRPPEPLVQRTWYWWVLGSRRERSKRQRAIGQAGRSRIHFQDTALAGQHSADFLASTHRGALSAHLLCLELWPPARDSGSSQPLLNGRCGGLARVPHESRGWTLKQEMHFSYEDRRRGCGLQRFLWKRTHRTVWPT